MADKSGARLLWASRGVRAAVGILLVAGAIILLIVLERTRPVPEGAGDREAIPVVRVMELAPVEAPLIYTGYGVARTMRRADISAQLSARVTERPPEIEPGMPVARGDLLVALEDVEFVERVEAAARRAGALEAELAGFEIQEAAVQRQIELAEQEVAIQQRDLERVRQLREQGAGSEAELDARLSALRRAELELAGLQERLNLLPSRRAALEATLQSQRAELAVAREDLSRTRISSPIDGFLQEVLVEEGELVAPGQLVARVVDLQLLEVPLRIPASAAGVVAAGDRAELWVDGPGERRWAGRVARVAPDVDTASRSLIVYVEVGQAPDAIGAEPPRGASGEMEAPDARALMRPGQFMVGRVRTAGARPALLVPRRAIRDDAVWVAEPLGDGLARLARRPARVERYVEGEFPALDQGEREWAVLDRPEPGDGTGEADGPREGDLILLVVPPDLESGATVRLAPDEGEGGSP